MKTYIRLWKYLAEFFLEWEIFQPKVVEKIKTHILYSVNISRKSYRLRFDVEKYGRAGQAKDGNIIRRMRITRWITKATNTHSELIILSAFPRQQCLHEGTPMPRLHRSTVPVLSLNNLRLERDCFKTVPKTYFLSYLGVFTFCACCILICLVCFVASFKLSCV